MAFSLISLNVERSKHLDRACAFLAREKANFVCLQELMERDKVRFEEAIGAPCFFAPVKKHSGREDTGLEGLGVFTYFPISEKDVDVYAGPLGEFPDFDPTNVGTRHVTERRVLMACSIGVDGEVYRFATTHFTWTPDGQPNDLQRADLVRLMADLEATGECVLCGDFNAPRGGEIFSAIAARYRDNIPAHYKTSLDISLHRAGKERPHELADKMVDGLFTTPAYRASNVELVSGISDHCAIVADIERVA